MKKIILLLGFTSLVFLQQLNAQYNNLWIPDTLSGTTFNLNIKDTFSQLRTGQQTITGGINNNFWGPTLFINKGDTVHMNVKNMLNDTTTLHWHGMHLPAVMDGGPHQVIPPGTIWQPYWKVNNQAGTYWYHPHLHEMTLEQLTKGIGGFIIVRDDAESRLALPRKYGIDDLPLVLTSRRYDASNQFVINNTAYGDYMLTNGTPNAQVTLPKQYVRLRILNAEIERGYNLGFSDNRTFYIIGNDGGLLNTPVAATRVKLLVGERIEIMVNLGNDNVGSSLDLKAYNSNQAFGFPGGEPANSGQFGSLLNNIDFDVLHINVGATTLNPITAVPSILATNVYWTEADATVNRSLTITGGQPGTNQPFVFDNTAFALNTINKTVDLNTIEKWTVTNNNVFGHTFHIHDVQFKIVARNGVATAVGDYESGWKDVMYVPRAENVSFVARFDDYSDSIHPYMYHCHFSNHEDDGMMGQFVVKNNIASPIISTLVCSNVTYSSTPTANTAYNGTATIGYTGGNGVAYTDDSSVASSGVTGLTATLQAGILANGSGNLTYSIAGTPSASGTAVFSITFGGQTCSISLTVNNVTPPPSTSRNVMLIIADDMGTDYLGFYENHQDTVDVPNIRYLVNHGIRFTNTTSDPVCSATRATMITGRYGFRTGVGAVIGGTGGSGVLDTNEITIPRLLKVYNNNLKRVHIGKWHLQQPTPVNLTAPNRLGFDHFEGSFIGTLVPNYNNWTKVTDGVTSTNTNYATTEQANNMCSWLRLNSTSPFYACLAFNAPHDPFHLPPAGLHSYSNLSGTPADISANTKSYYKAMIQAMDHELGRVFDSLRALNKFDSTDFIFIGDNGSLAKVAQTADTGRAKGTLYEYGVHVPLIISGPSVINPGRVSNALVNSADIFATVLELYGYNNWQLQIPSNKPVDSKSLMPVIKNQRDSVRPWAFTEIFKNSTDSSDGKAIKNKNYKLIRFDDGREQFYHLSADPNELNNMLVVSMNLTDSVNYAFLCNQLTNLVGHGNNCPSPVAAASVSGLDCNQVIFTSTDVYVNTPFNTIANLPYTGGNGTAYTTGNLISSTGVRGLIATLQSGQLTNGAGNLNFTISGTPTSTGTANFPINFGGQSCSISIQIDSLNSTNYNTSFDFDIVPNPVKNKLQIKIKPSTRTIYYAWVYDDLGRTIFMWPNPTELLTTGKDVSILAKGIYMLKIMDDKNKQVLTKKFIKQ